MAVIVETGAGVAGANSYASSAAADSYHELRGNAAWAALGDDAKDSALIRAADYLERTYGSAWLGTAVSTAQALSWPRSGVPHPRNRATLLAADIVPAAVVEAQLELALRASAGALLTDEGREVASESVGSISVAYRAGGGQQTRYAEVERLLAPLVATPQAFIAKVVR